MTMMLDVSGRPFYYVFAELCHLSGGISERPRLANQVMNLKAQMSVREQVKMISLSSRSRERFNPLKIPGTTVRSQKCSYRGNTNLMV